MKKTIEEVLAEATAANAALVTERDELRTAFEALAAEKTAASEAVAADISAKETKLSELTAAVDGLTREKADLVARIAELEGKAVSASVEAAKIAAAVGVAPVESAPVEQTAAVSHRDAYLAMPPSPERIAYLNKHYKDIVR